MTPVADAPSGMGGGRLALSVAVVGLAIVAAVAPLPLVLGALAALIAAAFAVRPYYDAAQYACLFLLVVAVLPATLTVPALGSLGAPQIFLGGAALAIWALLWLAPSGPPAAGVRPVPVLIVLFVAANLASYVAASMRPMDALEASAATRGMITVVAVAGIAMFTAELISSRDRLDVVLKAAVLAGAFIASVGIVQFATGYDLAQAIRVPGLQSAVDGASFIGDRSIFRRVAGTTMHAIEFSAVLCIMLPLALHLAVRESKRWLIPAGIMGIALPMSVSRTAALGLATVLLFVVPAWPRALRRRALIGIGVYLVGMRLLIPGLLGTIRALFADADADPSVATREMDYSYASEFIASRPWFGRGFATFIPTRYDFLDNQYLLSLVETGYVGVGAYLALLVGGIVTARRIRRRVQSDADRDLAQALTASLAVVISTSAAFDFLSFPTARAAMFVTLGLVGALWRLAPRTTTDSRGNRKTVALPPGPMRHPSRPVPVST